MVSLFELSWYARIQSPKCHHFGVISPQSFPAETDIADGAAIDRSLGFGNQVRKGVVILGNGKALANAGSATGRNDIIHRYAVPRQNIARMPRKPCLCSNTDGFNCPRTVIDEPDEYSVMAPTPPTNPGRTVTNFGLGGTEKLSNLRTSLTF
jgi:hypothetical protein